MANIFKKPGKVHIKKQLFQLGLDTLRDKGYKVERIPNFGKASVRQITKGRERLRVSIRTSQDTWIAFPRSADDKGWVTLSDVDLVLAVSVDDEHHPTEARVHWIPGDDMRKRFERAYKARIEAGYQVPLERGAWGIWVPLYIADDLTTARFAGGGAGIDHPPIARASLGAVRTGRDDTRSERSPVVDADGADGPAVSGGDDDKPLTISEAKRRLALTLGVAESSIKISVEA